MLYSFFFFVSFSSLALTCSILVILTKNPMNSTISLILCFCSIISLLLSVDVDYVALIFLIIYVGAITVILLFVSMLVNIRVSFIKESSWDVFLLCFVLFVNLLSLIVTIIPLDFFNYQFQQNWLFFGDSSFREVFFKSDSLKTLAYVLYNSLECLIISSMLLLLALIGSIFLTFHKNFDGKKQIITKQSMASLLFWQFL